MESVNRAARTFLKDVPVTIVNGCGLYLLVLTQEGDPNSITVRTLLACPDAGR
jgi:hypothetical protein